MKTKFNGILTLLLAFVVQITFAQEKTISGTVSESSGTLPGVSVVIKGTNKGTETDFDGKYSIKVNNGAVLVFRYLGYSAVEKTVGASNTINVTLSVDEDNVLEEVIVIGYGTTTKKAFAGTASTVSQENLEAKSFSNVTGALIGEVAGVTVINSSGQPGSVGTIRIRGYGSVNGNRSPLYVVDGVPYTGSINSINPSDIASTTILKDATATAIYGSRGANGVVVITTKTGSTSKSYIEVDVKTSINDQLIPRYNVVKSPEEYIGYVWEGIKNKAVVDGRPDPVGFANANLFTNN
ncbi:MAG: TonB-dependent receptor plug domain-containing protein, partial [Polaribacter sp.]